MTLHAITQYIRYRFLAKGRHGTHSPFVYAFVEDVVQSKKPAGSSFDWPIKRYTQLLDRVCDHYGYSSISDVPAALKEKGGYDVLLLREQDINSWSEQLKAALALLNDNGVVVAPDIHKDLTHTEAWERLHTLREVKLSLDLYGPGLLFFKKEFKEKQHFVLKYY